MVQQYRLGAVPLSSKFHPDTSCNIDDVIYHLSFLVQLKGTGAAADDDGAVIEVAVKELAVQPKAGIPGNVIREISCMKAVHSGPLATHPPNVAYLYGWQLTKKLVSIAMERGVEDLHSWLDRGGRGSTKEADAKILMLMACRGLAACHNAGVLHRDLRPKNCILTQAGELQIADFGSARHGAVLPIFEPRQWADPIKYTSLISSIFGTLLFIPDIFVFARKLGLAQKVGGCFSWYKPSKKAALPASATTAACGDSFRRHRNRHCTARSYDLPSLMPRL